MKTNRSARKIRNLRNTMFCLAVVALVGIAFTMGEYLAARFGQATVGQTEGAQVPSVGLSDLMVAMR